MDVHPLKVEPGKCPYIEQRTLTSSLCLLLAATLLAGYNEPQDVSAPDGGTPDARTSSKTGTVDRISAGSKETENAGGGDNVISKSL